MLVAASTVDVLGRVTKVTFSRLAGTEVEFAGDADVVFGGVEKMLKLTLMSRKQDLAAVTVMVSRVLAVVILKVLGRSEDYIAGRADEARRRVHPIEVDFRGCHL